MGESTVFTSEKIFEQLLDFISETFVVEKDEIETDKSLVQTGIIDSIGLIEIADFIEGKYNLKVGETDLGRENFGSVDKIHQYIVKKLGV